MPVIVDSSDRRYVEASAMVPGTPEQVWEAVATGPGMSAWFAPTELDERLGGVIRFDLGGGVSSSGTVTIWEPPTRFGYEEKGWNGEAPPLVTEVTIIPLSDRQCRILMVYGLQTPRGDWDPDLVGFEPGWYDFFDKLREYLEHG